MKCGQYLTPIQVNFCSTWKQIKYHSPIRFLSWDRRVELKKNKRKKNCTFWLSKKYKIESNEFPVKSLTYYGQFDVKPILIKLKNYVFSTKNAFFFVAKFFESGQLIYYDYAIVGLSTTFLITGLRSEHSAEMFEFLYTTNINKYFARFIE